MTVRCGSILLLAILCFCVHGAAGIKKFMLPKDRTAKLSSKHGSAKANLGMDGNANGVYNTGVQCVHTADGDPLPWWMLDMEQTYLIIGARVWNRIDCCAERFTQISIGVTSNPSVWTTFSTDLFDLCMYWPGVPTAADNPISFTCSRPIAGRYLAVHKNNSGMTGESRVLHFCEIDVIAFTKTSSSSYYVKLIPPSFSPTSSSLLTDDASVPEKSRIGCAIRCSVLPHCLFTLVSADGRDCWFFGSVTIPDSFAGVCNGGGASFLAVYG